MARGIAGGRPASLAVGYDVMIPPLSFLVAASLGIALGGAAIGELRLALVGIASMTGVAVHVARGLALAKVGPGDLAGMILWAIPYVAWKTAIVVHAVIGGGRRRWSQARALPSLRPVVSPAESKQ